MKAALSVPETESTPPLPHPASAGAGRAFVLAMALIVMIWAGAQLWLGADAIRRLDYPDTDDALRLAQIRDWMAGQSWFDTQQMRIHPPFGGDIHWSRIIDAPIAALIALATPILGEKSAEMAVIATYPLLLFALLLGLLACTARRHFGDRTARLAALLLPFSLAVTMQFAPLRIDHHGAQMICAMAALTLALRPPAMRTALASGVLMAVYMSISFEALPYVLLFGGLWAWPIIRAQASGAELRRAWQRLALFALCFTGVSAVLLLATRGFAGLLADHADAMSRPWLLASLAASTILALLAIMPRQGMRGLAAIAPLAVAAAAALITLLALSPHILAGPFANLPPAVRDYWYVAVQEGRPFWEQDLPIQINIFLPIAIGMLGHALAWRAADAAQRPAWEIAGLALIGAALIACLVLRGAGIAQVFALPGTAWLIIRLWNWSRTHARMAPRVAGILLVLAATPQISAPLLAGAASQAASPGAAAEDKANRACMLRHNIALLAALPKSTILAPIDMGAQMIEATPHSVVATPHHRNIAAIDMVIRTFLAAPRDAEAIMRESGATLLVICPGAYETKNYVNGAPNGLAAALAAGQAPPWLEPVATPRGAPYRIYRLRDAR